MTNAEARWSDGSAYDHYMGRWSSLVADPFVQWLDAPRSQRWLDAGCGTGRLAAEVVASQEPSSVEGVDLSLPFLAYARESLDARRVRFRVADIAALPYATGAFDLAISGLCLNFVRDVALATCELMRVTRPGGTVAAYVWDYAGDMKMVRVFWDVARTLDPASAELDEGRRSPLCNEDALGRLCADAGLRGVAVKGIGVVMRFASFDEYWSAFLLGQGVLGKYVAGLSGDARVALRDRLRCALETKAAAALALTARAWCVRGKR